MSDLAVTLTRSFPVCAEWAPKSLSIALPERHILTLGAILIVLQILDGVFTALGVSHFGINAEGNLFIRSLMEIWGPTTALLAVKGVAISVVCALCALAHKVLWIAAAMRGVIAVYMIAAIIPWSGILLTRI